MASEIKLPNLGDNVASGDVIDVKVKVGDQVESGQALIEVEAEKITAEVPTSIAGKVSQILVKKGDKVKPGQVIALIEGANGQPAKSAAPAKETAPPAQQAATLAEPAKPAAAPAKAAEPAKPAAK